MPVRVEDGRRRPALPLRQFNDWIWLQPGVDDHAPVVPFEGDKIGIFFK
jgi:hypothetical protein